MNHKMNQMTKKFIYQTIHPLPSSVEDNINKDNNRSKTRSIYGDDDSVTSNEERITPKASKPIYLSYKEACTNNTITCGRESITYGSKIGHDIATLPPPVTSEQHFNC